METASLFYWNPTVLCSSNLDGDLGAYHSEGHNLGKIIHMVDFNVNDNNISPHMY